MVLAIAAAAALWSSAALAAPAQTINVEVGCDELQRVADDVRAVLDSGGAAEPAQDVLAYFASCTTITQSAGASGGLLYQAQEQEQAHKAVLTVGSHLARVRGASGPVVVSDQELASLEQAHLALVSVGRWLTQRRYTAEELAWYRRAKADPAVQQERADLYRSMHAWHTVTFGGAP